MQAAWNRLEAAGLNGAGADGRHTHIAWPNLEFNPPQTNPTGFDRPVWAAVHYLPSEATPVTLGSQGKDETTGILQIDANQPRGTGDSQVRALLTALENYFTPGRTLTNGGEDVTVTAVGRTPGRVVDDRHYRVSLSVSWYARVQRPLIT
jgi:hypothetical protein